MQALTEKQRKVLKEIVDFFRREHRPPTTRELASLVHVHIKTVYQYLKALERKGCLERSKGKLRLSEALRGLHGIPLVGRVSAGVPLLAVENVEGTLDLEDLFGDEKELFLLRVSGDSMINAGILDGDLIVARKDARVLNGQIAVVTINEEATVKRVFVKGSRIRLCSENAGYDPMEFDMSVDAVTIEGKVTGLIRKVQ